MTDDLNTQFKYFAVMFKHLFETLVARNVLKAEDVNYILDQAMKVLEDDNINKEK